MRTQTHLNKKPKKFLYSIVIRTMFKSRDMAAKVTFNCLNAMLSQNVVEKITKTNHRVFIDSLMTYTFDQNQGIIQQKGILLHMLYRQKYISDQIHEAYTQKKPDTVLEVVPNVMIDFRTFTELPVIYTYENTFKPNIKRILSTCDTIESMFEKKKQSNLDYHVDLISKYGSKTTYQDAKAGMGMVKHSTTGSIGILTYDTNKQLIPFTNKDIVLSDINTSHVNRLEAALEQDHISTHKLFSRTLEEVKGILYSKGDPLEKNDKIQQCLWDNLQCHPEFKRSVSFIFSSQMSEHIMPVQYDTYLKKFLSLLQEKTYDLTKMQDRKDIFRAMIISYKEIDPDILKKIEYLNKGNNIHIDNVFIHTIFEIFKTKL